MADPEMDEFFAAVGRVISSWSALEYNMCLWFIELLAGPSKYNFMALFKVFNSGRNFSTKRDLLEAAVEGTQKQEVKDFVLAAAKKAGQFSSFRNKVAHDMFIQFKSKNGNHLRIQSSKAIFQDQKPVLLIDLIAAEKWIKELRRILVRVLQEKITTQEGLSLIEALPDEANHPPNVPIPPKKKPTSPKQTGKQK